MKALWIERKPGGGETADLTLTDIPDPEPKPGEALIKVRSAGICRTDLELLRGYMDFTGIPGHEFVGEVIEVADTDESTDTLVGRRVVGEINCGCGNCSWCRCGLSRHCPERTVLGISNRPGSFAEYLTLPVGNLHAVPDSISDRTAVFTEPLAAAMEIMEQVKIEPDRSVLVIGDGKLGLLICRVLQIHGCSVTCLGSHKSKLKLAAGWGVKTVPRDDFLPEMQYDTVIEASGSSSGFTAALTSLKPRGTLILKSTYAGSLDLDASPLVINEITVVGSRCGPFPPALRLLEQGLIPTEDLISGEYPFSEAGIAFRKASEPEALKILINFT